MMDAASSSDWQMPSHATARYYRTTPLPDRTTQLPERTTPLTDRNTPLTDARPFYPPYARPMGGYMPSPYAHPGYGHHSSHQVTPQHMMAHGHSLQPLHGGNIYAPNALMESYISSSSTRLARNFAEKQRRTKLNTYIDELRSLVPMVSSSVAARSGKKVDKTSILRLSATFLRMHQILYSNKSQLPSLPPELSDFNWSQFILDDLDGVMLLVTSAGKIVFITHTIDKILGHNQTDLFGQSLYSFTCPEDHDELRKNLSPDLDPSNLNPAPTLSSGGSNSSYCGGNNGDASSGDDEAESSCGASSPQSSAGCGSSAANKPPLTTTTERQRRSFYLRLRVKGCSRSEKPQYELVHVVGHLRITRRVSEEAAGSVVPRRCRKSREFNMSSNDIVLVAVIKPFKERRVTDLSLIESTREEYITRHLRDGRIIYCDHRISYVSGYLASEVSGLSGFMFMHKEDMKWTMIALRQMFIKSESYGSSCYRLIDKTGKFIYLKTYGYLEFDPHEAISDDYFPSFICVNTLLSAEEGEQAIASMKQRFTPLIQSRDEPGTLAIAESLHQEKSASLRSLSSDSVEPAFSSLTDPDELKDCVRSLISNLPPTKPPQPPSPCALSTSSSTPLDTPYHHKLAMAAKSMPPASVQTAKMGLKSKSNVTTIRPDDRSHPSRKEELLNAPNNSLASSVQNRPSVLRGPIKTSERCAGPPKRPRDDDSVFSDIEICDKKPRASYESTGVLVSPQSASSMSSYCQSPSEPVTTTDNLHSNSTYLNLDMQDGMDMGNIIEAPSFIVDEESEEELKHTPVHSSEMFELWENTQVGEDITSLDKTSLRLTGLEFSSLTTLKQRHHHKSPNNGAKSPSLRHSFPS